MNFALKGKFFLTVDFRHGYITGRVDSSLVAVQYRFYDREIGNTATDPEIILISLTDLLDSGKTRFFASAYTLDRARMLAKAKVKKADAA